MKVERKNPRKPRPGWFMVSYALATLSFLIMALSEPAKPPHYIRMTLLVMMVIALALMTVGQYLQYRKAKKNETE